MQRTNLGEINCSIARTVNILGEWWTPLILRDLLAGISQFDELQRDLGISTNVLTDRLSSLVEHGVVEREPYGPHPNRFAYRLTAKGEEVLPIVLALMAWGDKWTTDRSGAPTTLVHTTCGHPTTAVPHCAECGERLRREDIVLHAGPGGRVASGTMSIGAHLEPPFSPTVPSARRRRT
jgi:DNA-binding HxlR family transcriptional regulator